MENNKKPEWFELADNDQPVDRPMKKAPKRSLSLILAGVLVIPMGAGFALLSHDEHSAVASEGLNFIQDSPALGMSPAAQPSDAIVMPTSSREDDDEEGDDDEYRAPVFSNSTSSAAPAGTPATVQSTQASPAKSPAAITAPSANASKDLILPPTKKADDDDDHHEGKKNKKSERDHEDDDEEDDD
jgi:hypothetical protein